MGKKYHRVGDLLTFKTMCRCIIASGGTSNFIFLFSACCHYQHNLMRERCYARRRYTKERNIPQDKLEEISKINQAAGNATQFLCSAVDVFSEIDHPSIPVRSGWMHWSVVDITTGVKSPEMGRYCYEQIKAATAHDSEHEDKFQSYLQDLKRLHLMIVMVTSQQTKDELQLEQYFKIT
jgi:hypothetical protein